MNESDNLEFAVLFATVNAFFFLCTLSHVFNLVHIKYIWAIQAISSG